jgi:hypothetical protein
MNKKQFQHFMREHRASGLSAKAFCKAQNVSYSQFLYARRNNSKNGESVSIQAQSDFIEVVSKASDKSSIDSPSHAVVRIGNTSVSIPMTASEHEWLKVFRALQSAPLC